MHPGELLSYPPTGVFTPTVGGITTPGVGTYVANQQQGRFNKVGNLVFVALVLQWTAHTGTGNMRVSGLPFVSGGASGMRYNLLATPGSITYAGDGLYGQIGTGVSYADIRNYVSAGANALIALPATGVLQLQGFYMTD